MNSPRPTVGVENLESRRLLAAQAPYLGAPFLVGSAPATIEAEHYDIGGQGISYNDTTATNTAGAFRTGANEGVDTKLITTGQFRISDAYEGEWVEYSLDVQQAGDFRLELRVSNADPGAKLHVEIDGVDVTGQLTVPDTNSFNSFGTVGKDITLAAGARVLRLCFDVGAGPTRSVAGVDWLRLMPIAPEPQPEPDASATLTTTRASYIRDGSYADQNFGSASQLLVKRSANVGNTRESYLKFDVSSLAAGSVQSATLRLFGNTGNGSGSVGGGGG
ncbi:MAG TPA: carbohydrate-binding protein, partial [Tepidisphaeraceae bacterium]|nr:carbohydrate-binding protein [Tepidisphaeraceae bacterium]